MSISIFGIIVGALLWGIVLSGWAITRRIKIDNKHRHIHSKISVDNVPKLR